MLVDEPHDDRQVLALVVRGQQDRKLRRRSHFGRNSWREGPKRAAHRGNVCDRWKFPTNVHAGARNRGISESSLL
eukprot:scaffold447_cov307-Pinguiococcus_pyrenoidosus.AAC.75